MDKVKVIIAGLVMHGFWILCGLVMLVALGTWYIATAKLRTERQAGQELVAAKYSTGSQIIQQGLQRDGAPFHPNTTTNQETKKANKKTLQSVYDSWKEQYNSQGTQVFVWPKLSQSFLDKVQKLRPIESTVEYPTPPEEELPVDDRTTYRDYIYSELPMLAELISSKWGPGAAANSQEGNAGPNFSAAAAGPEGGDLIAEEEPAIVEWSTANQSVLQSHFNWSRQPDGVPTTLQILYAQEDLWVLKALVTIIKKTNLINGEDPDEPRKAVIKQIASIQIGSAASGQGGSIRMLSSSSEPGAATPGFADQPPEGIGAEIAPMDPGAMIEGDGQPGGGATLSRDPAEGRYVDKDYQPLPAESLRKKQAGLGGSQEEMLLTVAKRMPVRLQLVMDHRQINKLLAACANFPLIVEVRQVRVSQINGRGSTSSSVQGGAGPQGGGNFGIDAESAISPGGGQGNRSDKALSPYDRNVEIYGIIYIYNPDPESSNQAAQGQDPSGNPNNSTATVPSGS